MEGDPSLAFSGALADNEEVITVTEPQVWVMIGVFTTLMFGVLTIISTLFVRVVRSEVGGLRAEIGGLSSEVGSVRTEMNARFEAMNQRMDGLDRDVQALVKHTFGLDRG